VTPQEFGHAEHTCGYCGEEVDVSEAKTTADIAHLLIAHLNLTCTAAPGSVELGPMSEAQASAELAGATPQHWTNRAAQHFEKWDLISMGGVLLNTHHERMCAPPCCIHSPSPHHMREWPQHWSQQMNVVFRQCAHGAYHPDPDDLRARTGTVLHQCDGCCLPPQDDGRLLMAGT
jgi:hypothetical protein